MLIIGIAGGSASGKTTVVNKISESLPKGSFSILSQDAYYWDNGSLSPAEKKEINFDHPNAIEWDLMIRDLDRLIAGQSIEMPIYTYSTCSRAKETITVKPSQVIIVEGILIFTNPELCKRMNIKVFVDAEADVRLMRLIARDTKERGRDVNDVLVHYQKFVKPMHEQFIEPTKRLADLIVPHFRYNDIAIDVLTTKIKNSLL